jgi:hypothetical protein
MRGQTIIVECPGDKLHEAVHQLRDMGMKIEITWDELIQKWIIRCD